MEYPKPIMELKEMQALGYSMPYLRRIVHHRYADKFVDRTSERGKYRIDTKEFEKLRRKGALL